MPIRFIKISVLSAIAGFVLCLAAGTARAGEASNVVRTYAAYCANCHGKWGRGHGPVVPVLKTKPQDLSNAERLSKLSDEQLFRAIKYGGSAAGMSPEMPGWGQGLDDDQIKALVSYIRSGELAKRN